MFHAKFHISRCILWSPILKMAKTGPFYCQNMVKLVLTWIIIIVPRDVPYQISHCRVYPVVPFLKNGQNMALLLPKHGLYMVLQFRSSWILIIVPRDVPCQILHCYVYPVAPFTRNGQNMALLWPKHGPHMVLQIGSSWIIIDVPRDGPCQISKFWVYPMVPFSKNCQNMALYGHNMVLMWSLKLALPES